jgi:hypothetical protein
MLTRKTRVLAVAATGVLAATAVGGVAAADNDRDRGATTLTERLTGYEETPLALSTSGTGSFRARISADRTTISYRLGYSALEGAVTQAHIHVGATGQSGGVSAFLCSNLGNGPAGTQPCPAAPAVVTGTLTSANVIGPAGQGVAAGEFAELVRAIRAGAAYVNVHSDKYPAGEIRSQLDGHRH